MHTDFPSRENCEVCFISFSYFHLQKITDKYHRMATDTNAAKATGKDAIFIMTAWRAQKTQPEVDWELVG